MARLPFRRLRTRISWASVDLLALFAAQERNGFADLAGSDGQLLIKVSEPLLNTIITDLLQKSTAIRELQVKPRAGNKLGVRLALAKPSFLPPISLDVTIDKQPSLPDDPVLGVTLSGLGGLAKFAGGFLKSLPPGVRMDGNQVFIDIRAALAANGLTSILDYLKDVAVGTEEGRLIVVFNVGVRG
jgi:hypothetical protein